MILGGKPIKHFTSNYAEILINMIYRSHRKNGISKHRIENKHLGHNFIEVKLLMHTFVFKQKQSLIFGLYHKIRIDNLSMILSTFRKDVSTHLMLQCFGCVLRPINSEVIERLHPHLLSLANDVKPGKYTIPTGNLTPGCCMAVHYNVFLMRNYKKVN